MSGYAKIDVNEDRQFDLTPYIGEELKLRSKIGFAIKKLPEDLHYEESYEFLIPQDGDMTVKIFCKPCLEPNKGKDGGGTLPAFDTVTVKPGEILVVWPMFCHLVAEEEHERFIALKPEKKYKILAKEDKKEKGCCKITNCTLWDYCLKLGEKNKLKRP